MNNLEVIYLTRAFASTCSALTQVWYVLSSYVRRKFAQFLLFSKVNTQEKIPSKSKWDLVLSGSCLRPFRLWMYLPKKPYLRAAWNDSIFHHSQTVNNNTCDFVCVCKAWVCRFGWQFRSIEPFIASMNLLFEFRIKIRFNLLCPWKNNNNNKFNNFKCIFSMDFLRYFSLTRVNLLLYFSHLLDLFIRIDVHVQVFA